MKSSKQIVAAAILALVPCAANAQAVISERTLSMNAAQEMANAALEACRKEGCKVTIS
jgi:amino acid permease